MTQTAQATSPDQARRAIEASDQRSDFQRDRGRILYSDAFRRLAGVTQVTSAHGSHRFHNRLTHSLKVGQLARRIAEYLVVSTDPELLRHVGGLDPDCAEAAGFGHDLGHPPFGHAAEEELSECVGDDAGGFEGNAQTFRIISDLEARLPAEDERRFGLNLTRRTLNGTLKYPWRRKQNPHKPHKWGYYSGADDDAFQWARQGCRRFARSLEAEVMDWADDVTFATHDMEDFVRSGQIPPW